MRVVTAEEMKEIDKRAVKNFSIPALLLMENAGIALAEKAKEMLKGTIQPRVAVISGKGNNGGDGLAAARHLKKSGIEVTVYLLGRKRDLKGDVKINSNIAGRFLPVIEMTGNEISGKMKNKLQFCDLVIDAIVGIGAKGKMSGTPAAAITAVLECGKPVLCADVPSGLDCSSGVPLGVCIKGNETVTFGFPKAGLLQYPGANFAGSITIADIGLPEEFLRSKKASLYLLEEKEIASALPPRPGDGHKASMGHVLVLAGSRGYTGAAALTGMGALRSGCGLVTLGIPRSLNMIFETKLTEVITKPLPETEATTLGLEAENEILDITKSVQALAIGPGLARHPETQALVRKLIMTVSKPMIIDADGLNILEGDISVLGKRQAPTVITPHPGEMGRMLGIKADEVQKKRISISKEISTRHEIITVLKGAKTIITSTDGNTFINPTGNSGMATAGTGDVLTGVISSLIARGMDCLEAAKAGVFIHGLAGDIAAEAVGEESLIAGDLLNCLPEAFKRLENYH